MQVCCTFRLSAWTWLCAYCTTAENIVWFQLRLGLPSQKIYHQTEVYFDFKNVCYYIVGLESKGLYHCVKVFNIMPFWLKTDVKVYLHVVFSLREVDKSILMIYDLSWFIMINYNVQYVSTFLQLPNYSLLSLQGKGKYDFYVLASQLILTAIAPGCRYQCKINLITVSITQSLKCHQNNLSFTPFPLYSTLKLKMNFTQGWQDFLEPFRNHIANAAANTIQTKD